MALTPDQAKELRDMLKEIEQLSIKLKANINTTSLQNVEANADTIKRLFKDLKEEWNDLTSDISIATQGFRDIVKEISRQNVGLNDSLKAYKSLTSIADKIQAYQKGYSDMSYKDIIRLKERIQLEKQRLENAQDLLKEEGRAIKIREKALKDEIKASEIKINNLQNDRKASLAEIRNREKLKAELAKINKEHQKITAGIKQNIALLNDEDEAFKNLNLSIEKIALETINDLDKQFKNIINDVSTTDDIVKNMSKSFENLSSIAQKVQEYQENITDVSKEDVGELIKKVELEKQRLVNSLNLLNLEKERLTISLEANRVEQQNAEARINELQSKGTLLEEEKAELAALETKKNSLLNIENEISSKIEANTKLTEKTQEYISGQNEEYQKLIGTLNEVESGVGNINKSFGLNIGKNLKGALGKAGLGNLADMLGIDKATAKMKNLTTEYTKGGKQALTFGQQFKVIGGGLASMGGNLLKGFNPVMLALTGIVKLVQFFIEAMFEADQQVTDIAKSMVISKEAARGVRDRFFEISDNAKIYAGTLDNQLLTQKELVAANLKINELLGTSIDFSSQLGDKGKYIVAQFAAASKFLKLSEEEQKGLLDLQATSGEEINKIRNTVLGTTSLYKIQTGVLLNERKVLENVLKASNAIKLSTKGGLEGLTKSAIEAAKLGLSLQKVSDIAGGLLDFENQITAELEAELITGKDLNLELAQQAALNNDLATVASEISKNVGSAADFAKMNRLEQEAFAKAVGMTKEELADVLTTQEQLTKLKGKFNALTETEKKQLEESGKLTAGQIATLRTGKGTVVEYYDALQQAGVAQKDIVELLGEQAAASLSSQTAQEKFNESLEKAKEIFTRFVDGGTLDKLADFITKFVASVAQKGLWNTLTGGVMSNEEILLEQKKQLERQKTNAATEEEKQEIDQQLIEVEKQLTQSTSTRQIEATAKEKGITISPEQQSRIDELQKEAKLYEEATSNIFSELFAPQKVLDYKKALSEAAQAELDRLATETKSGGIKNLQSESYIREKSAAETIVLPPSMQGPKLATGGIITSPINNATIGEAGPEAVIPLESSIGRKILNLDRESTLTSNNDIANSIVTLINKISTTVPTITSSTPNTSILPENSIKPLSSPIQPLTLTTDNQSVSSNNDSNKLLQEAVNLLKAIQSKETPVVQVAVDGKVIAEAAAPSIGNEITKRTQLA
jgi:hypothetical protein